MQEDHIELEIGGTLQQSIANCIQVMDILLRQNEAAIVSSMVVAEKKTSTVSGTITEVISDILGTFRISFRATFHDYAIIDKSFRNKRYQISQFTRHTRRIRNGFYDWRGGQTDFGKRVQHIFVTH